MLLFLVLAIVHQCMLIARKKNILVLGEDLTLRLDDAFIRTEAIYSINFRESGIKFVLIVRYSGSNTFWAWE